MSSSFVVQLDLSLADKLRQGLEAAGFVLSTPPYTLFQGKKKGVSCTLYTSGKLVVQGSEKKEFIEYYLEPEILGTFSFGYEANGIDRTARIGVDESGKGDYFGPLCVAGVFASSEGIERLLKIGVRDSKRITDASIFKMATLIRTEFPHKILTLFPQKYNELYEKFGNLNLLLGWGHATVIEQLFDETGCDRALIDQFASEHVVLNALARKKKRIILSQRPRAEEDPVVAAASILARAAFVNGLQRLSEECGHPLPKGASKLTLAMGKRLVSEFGGAILEKTAKLHFKTTQEILE